MRQKQLSEQKLQRIVKNNIREFINESEPGFWGNFAKGFGNGLSNNYYNKQQQKANQFWQQNNSWNSRNANQQQMQQPQQMQQGKGSNLTSLNPQQIQQNITPILQGQAKSIATARKQLKQIQDSLNQMWQNNELLASNYDI